MKKIISISLSIVIMISSFFTVIIAQAEEQTDITACNISLSFTSSTYTGGEIKPNVSITNNSNVLTLDTDYSVSYSNNINCGTASVTINGIGSYKGSSIRYFTIAPTAPTAVYASDIKTTSVLLKWNGSTGAVAYQVFKSTSQNGSYSICATTNSTSATISGLTAGNTYFYKVVAYADTAMTIASSDSLLYTSAVKPSKVTIKQVTKESSTSIKVVWGKVNCVGYQLQYTTDKSFKSNVKTIYITNPSTVSKTIKGLKKNKTYYARIRAYTNSNSTNYYGSWSTKLNSNYSKLYASYSSKYVNNKDRTTNLKIASKEINGTVISPGETFSLNKVVGKRTAAKGYKKAHVFTSPSSMTMGIGGGICQVASTVFNAALIANLQIVERHQHSQRVSYVPLGRDSAIYWGSEDLKFKNNTKYPIMVKMSVSGGTISCKMYVCKDVSPKKVKLKVTRKSNKFTLKRYVGGKVNYTCTSKY